MSNPLGLTAAELAGLLALIEEPHDHDHDDHDHDDHDHKTRYFLPIVSIQQRAEQLTRVTVRVPDDIPFAPWCLPNVALRLELPIQPPELQGIEGAPETASRVYTVAVANPATREVAIDFVMHVGVSVAMQWLGFAKPGDLLETWVPHQHRLLPAGRRQILVADSTALPAALSILTLQETSEDVTLIARVPADELPEIPNVHVIRTDGPLGDAFLDLDLTGVDAVWGAGESGDMRTVRTHCRKVLGLNKEQTQVFGYWKQGTSNTAMDIERLRVARDYMQSGGDPAALQDTLEEAL